MAASRLPTRAERPPIRALPDTALRPAAAWRASLEARLQKVSKNSLNSCRHRTPYESSNTRSCLRAVTPCPTVETQGFTERGKGSGFLTGMKHLSWTRVSSDVSLPPLNGAPIRLMLNEVMRARGALARAEKEAGRQGT